MSDLSVGDVVSLPHVGGPDMTVTSVNPRLYVVYFLQNTLKTAAFDPELLVKEERNVSKNNFNKGDCVQLLSGGPPMLVVGPMPDSNRLSCLWYNESEGKYSYQTFPPQCLASYKESVYFYGGT